MKLTTLFRLIFLLLSVTCYSKTYYVSNTGNDSNSGTSSKQAWKTLDKINNYQFTPGDSILLRRGDKWFGSLNPQSGVEGKYIYYGAYGEGEKPVLHMSIEVSGWAQDGKNIWRNTGQGVYGNELLEDPSFDHKLANWNLRNSNGADSKILRDEKVFYSSPAGMSINCSNSGKAGTDIQVSLSNMMNLESGKTYEFSFYAKSSKPFAIEDLRFPEGTIGPISFDTKWAKYRVQFSPKRNVERANFVFSIGQRFPAGGTLCIDNVSLKEFDYVHLVDIAFLKFNLIDSIGVKCWYTTDLDKPGEFCFDTRDQSIKLYNEGNPDTCYSDIKCIMTKHIINESNKSYVMYENLALTMGGAHGIGGDNTLHIIIRNCDFSYIGGGRQSRTVRYGNAIEFWAEAHDNLVEGCKLWEIYDAALTNQSNVLCKQENITYKNNIIWNSEYSFEFFNYNEKSVTRNIQFINNTCINAGYGLKASQRIYSAGRGRATGRHICIWSTPYNASDFIVKNNIFYNASEVPIYLPKGNLKPFTFDYNCWTQSSGNFANLETGKYTSGEFELYRKNTGEDKHSIFADPKLVDIMNNNFTLKPDSPCIGKGDPKLNTKEKVKTDIGALPYTKK